MRVIELHSPVKLVQRSKGQTATAAAAYRSGTRIECERTGEVHDYRRKQGIELTALLFPIDAPDHLCDRQKLWNAAEKREKHPRAQTARDLEVSFPAEFSPEQRREAGLLIGNYLVDNYGAAADLCWHEPDRRGDERNYHLHALFTTRRFEQGDWSKTKDRTLDDLKGKGAEEITKLRQNVADILNNIAARDGLEIYVEHLSFEKRGIDKEPTQHLGKYASQLEKRGIKSEIGNQNREIKSRNAEREQLHVEQKAVNMEIKRAQLEVKGQGINQTSAQLPKNNPPKPGSDAFKVFYQETQKRRSELLRELDGQYKQQEDNSKQELAQLFNTVSQKGIFGFWRRVTGKTRQDQEQISKLQKNLEFIQKQKQEKFRVFEQERQNRLEMLKKQQDQEKSIERSPANDINPSISEKVQINNTISPTGSEKDRVRANLERKKQRQLQRNKTINLDRN